MEQPRIPLNKKKELKRVKKRAVFIKIADEMLDDIPFMERVILNNHR